MKWIFFVLLSILWHNSIWAAEPFVNYQKGKAAIRHQDWQAYHHYQQKLTADPFFPLLKYHYLASQIEVVDVKEIKVFLNTYPNSPMAIWLTRKWLNHLFLTKQYNAYTKNYLDVNQQKHKCKYLYALQQQGELQKGQQIAKKLFNTEKTLPDLCESIYGNYLNELAKPKQEVWQRFKALLSAYNFKVAKQLIKHMSEAQKNQATAILRLYKQPNLISNKTFLVNNYSAEVMSYGLYRLARISPSKAASLLKKYKKKSYWNKLQLQRVYQAIALKYALRKDKRALLYYRKLIGHQLPRVYQTYLFKAALFYNDWLLIKDTIEAFSKEKQQVPRFKYWHAKSLLKLGKSNQAYQELQQLAKLRNYYGFLASYHLKLPAQLNHQQLLITEQDRQYVNQLAGMIRAKVFYKHNKKHQARLELFYLMKHQNPHYKYVIAKEVANWGWHSQAIRLSNKLKFKDDLNLRFPIKYKSSIKNYARKYQVPMALIFSIIRQESLFTENIKSPAGAVGLMQLMPSTAHRTSKQYKLAYKGAGSLVNPQANLKLGIAHLNRLKKELNNQTLLMIASYNAGKKAAKRWLPKHNKKMFGDKWIEMVSYQETRRYLRHVVTNYVIYQQLLGHKPDMSKILSDIKRR